MSDAFLVSYVALWLLVALESIMLFVLLRELGRIYLTRSESFAHDGVAIGKPLPELQVRARTGGRGPLQAFFGNKVVLLVVGTAGCDLCLPAARMAKRWTQRIPTLTTMLLLDGPSLGAYRAIDDLHVVLAARQDIEKRLFVRASPFVFVLEPSGAVLAKGIVNTHHHIKTLLQHAQLEFERRYPGPQTLFSPPAEVKIADRQLAAAAVTET